MNTAYLNDEFIPIEDAKVSTRDRGFLFADGVYEVIPVYGGRLFRLGQHLSRLNNSLAGIHIDNPLSDAQWQAVLTRLVEMNGGAEQSVYVQVTRGVDSVRDHPFPANVKPTVYCMSSPLKMVKSELLQQGASVITGPDIRWQYCHLKTIALLPNVLMQQAAKDQGADEVILLRDGYATECSASNLFIVKQGVIVTPPKSDHLLPGVTRDLVLELAKKHNVPCVEQNIAEKELVNATEIWITSSSKEIVPVTQLNGQAVAGGQPGALWKTMLEHYQTYKTQLINGEVE